MNYLAVHFACAMCLGGATGELALATTFSVVTLLSFVVVVLGCFLAFIFCLARKARLAAEEERAALKVRSGETLKSNTRS